MRRAPQCSRRFWPALLPLIWAVSPAPAADKSPPNTGSGEGQWVFSFLPKSFQDNPQVDQTVITEMTDDGRKLPPPTPDHPAYYIAQASGYHVEGHGTAAEQPPPQAELDGTIKRALAVNSYQPASPGHPASLLILYVWGVHNNLDQGSEFVEGAFHDAGHKNLLSRAALVGGNKFAAELRAALNKEDRLDDTTKMPLLDPLKLFVERDWKTRRLYEQARAECYYVVASAYDYAAGARGERKLLWRSKMTVDSAGVSMTDTLPTLVLNAAQYLGRDMPEAATMLKRAQREGHARLGPLEVKEYLDQPPVAASGPAVPPKPEPKP